MTSRVQLLDKASSLRLDTLRFPLIVGVVFIHAYGGAVVLAEGAIGAIRPGAAVDLATGVISQGIARIAVPMFFLMAGYLLFLGLHSAASYLEKLHSRSRTLLIPFLFWNIATLGIYALAQALPYTREFFSGRYESVATFDWFDYLNAIFGIDRRPISYQFWFIRDLMLLVLLAPLIDFALRIAPWPLLVVLLAGWFADIWPVYAPSVEASLFFCAGAWFSRRGTSLFALDRFGAYFGVAYMPLVVLDVLSAGQPFHATLHRLGILVGICVALWLTRLALEAKGLFARLRRLERSSFFVFAVHEPLLTILKKLSYKLLAPSAPAHILLLYFAIPIATILAALLIHRVMLRIGPRFTAVITGGR